MKKLLFFTSCICMYITVCAQQKEPRYSPTFGLLGGANYSSFRLGDNDLGVNTDWRWGWAAGLFAGFPIGKVVSLEPQVLYSTMGGKTNSGNDKSDNQLDYLSVPVLIKIHAGRFVNLFVGPQFDFLMSAKDKDDDNADIKDILKDNDVALTGGFELFPRHRISIYARYIYGLQNISQTSPPKVYNQGIQAGLKFTLFGVKPKVVAPPPPPPPPPAPLDSDGDGVPDNIDKCPNQSGSAKYNGCPIPDSDGDGINDEDDKCPNQAGTAKYNGCPIPDSDGDGINDEEDKCPNQAGTAKYGGCPIPDTDGDGINDEEDKCPTIAGVRENNGCPAIEKFKSDNVQFVTGSSTLTKGANTELSQLAAYMNKYPETKVEIDGFTDNTGKAETNQKLSEKRAVSAKAFLVKKGISADRITTNGYGAEQPIADNSTAAGRTKNRRVEFKVTQ